jgi:hypothetical protein
MPSVHFQHERVNGGAPLTVETGVDEIAWAYRLNVAKYPTYGGEVVQILSAFIDDITITGTVGTYEKAEEIYSFFMQYFIIATQGPSSGPGASFEQTPMIMTYPHRDWTFEIQPLHAPGFTYSKKMVAPKWFMTAHVVDKGLDVESLKAMVVKETVHEAANADQFKLTGVISPDSGDPALNPFIAPVRATGKTEFKEQEAKEITEGLGKIADYYNSLLPAYMNGNFADIIGVAGAKPEFGHGGKGEESPDELLQGTPNTGEPQPKIH